MTKIRNSYEEDHTVFYDVLTKIINLSEEAIMIELVPRPRR